MKKTVLIKVTDELEYQVKFPTVGQLQDIEAAKLAYTNGRYVDMAIGGLKTHTFALDSADTIAYFSVLIPELRKDLELKNWREIDPFKLKELMVVYKKQFLVWFKPIVDDLYNFDTNDSEDGEDEE